ncbi:hypothetical protein LX64_03142 [Chitinophaga skermanii]|uniref:Uncharacterized protein n=1 Tax=Chitinophaga skermanii TaxID=331697 RepID=A0A327QKP2_9BACT|nr:hypothetical protein [Chitinophaga skermanii]RAJ04262.1 hypothetical protein LX64_03142 [Chitinophaga skermanii]
MTAERGGTNYELSAAEWAIARDAEFIYAKNRVIDKVYEMMGVLQGALAETSITGEFAFPGNCLQYGAKISKGEKYEHLPWVILDYPRLFKGAEVFAFRTMFWWGQYFSCTLHLAGEVKDRYAAKLLACREQLAGEGFSVCIHADPWLHHFDDTNYRSISKMQQSEWEQRVLESSFIKLAKPFALSDWGNIIPLTVHAYTVLLGMLYDQNLGGRAAL